MVDSQQSVGDVQFLLSDFNTRLRDVDERNKLVRERVLLLGRNFLSSREQVDGDIRELKRENERLHRDVDRLKRILSQAVSDIEQFVKRDEMVLVERMLKDFQPLEFMRRKDVESLLDERFGVRSSVSKHIKKVKPLHRK